MARKYLDMLERMDEWRYNAEGYGDIWTRCGGMKLEVRKWQKRKSTHTEYRRRRVTPEKAKRDATNTAVASTWAIMFSVLRDKEGYDYNRLRRIWDETNYLADSIARKYVKIDDLIEELRENGIALA